MRTFDLSVTASDDGAVQQIGWTVRNEEGDCLALGCQLGTNVTNLSLPMATLTALHRAEEALEREELRQLQLPMSERF